MKKALAGAFKGKKQVDEEEEIARIAEAKKVEEEANRPETGFGRFEYVGGQQYVGNWQKQIGGKKVKHGHGKMTKPGL